MSHPRTPSILNESDTNSICPDTYHVPAFIQDFIQPNPHAWIIGDPDPGNHICNSRGLFTRPELKLRRNGFKLFDPPVKLKSTGPIPWPPASNMPESIRADGLEVKGMGFVELDVLDCNGEAQAARLQLKNVLFVPDLAINILSAHQLWKDGLQITTFLIATPEANYTPDNSAAPEASDAPDNSAALKTRAAPETRTIPETIAAPETRAAPENIAAQEAIAAPEAIAVLETRAAPENIAAPETSATPETIAALGTT
ncbi:hypothetical protein AOQ84DRAFT_222629, partial [Glonium stellatum]